MKTIPKIKRKIIEWNCPAVAEIKLIKPKKVEIIMDINLFLSYANS